MESMSNDENRPEGRPRGTLTEADREFLRNRKEYSRQAAHARQNAIVERTRNAILDFSLLFDHLTQEDWEDVSGHPPTPTVWFDDPAFDAGVRDTLASMILVSGGRGLIEGSAPVDPTSERLLRDAFERVAWRYMLDMERFELIIEAERIRWRQLLERLEDGEELSIDELSQLLIATRNDLDTGALQRELREQLTGDE